jgi:hypothetical protein
VVSLEHLSVSGTCVAAETARPARARTVRHGDRHAERVGWLGLLAMYAAESVQAAERERGSGDPR